MGSDTKKTLIGRIIKKRETEPKRLWLTKIIFVFIFFLTLFAYVYYTVVKILDASLSVKYSTRKNHLDMPTINITTPFQMNINCTILYAEGLGEWSNQSISSCDDHITQSEFYNNYYLYTFKPPSDKKFEISEPGVRQINMVFTVPTVPANINSPEIILIKFFDEALVEQNQIYSEETLQDLINSTLYVNTYALNAYRHIRFSLSRIERTYLFRDWRSYVGFIPRRILIPLITTSKFLDYQMTPERTVPDNTNILSIGLFATTNLVQQELEIRDDTFGGWIGSIGGLIGLMLTIFTFLFGTKNLVPFGMVQKFCCLSRTKRKFENLSVIPLVKSTRLQDEDILSLENKVIYLTNRLHSLETILTDYVISSDLIHSLADQTATEKNESKSSV